MGFLLLFTNMPLMAEAGVEVRKSDPKQTRKDVDISSSTAGKAYRIEVEKDGVGVPLKVNFISPDGKTIKTMFPDKTIIAQSGKSLIHQSGYRESPDFDYEEYDRELMNAKGEVKWRKSWKNYPEYGVDPEAGWSGWFEGIADNGERSYITYRSTDGVYNLVVLGKNGEELARISYPEMISGLEISPDGKIVGANVEVLLAGRRWKHFLFLDVDTGKTKIVRAENQTGYGQSSLHTLTETREGPQPLKSRQITLYWLDASGASKDNVVTFDSLPDDIHELFVKEAEEK